MALGSKVMIRVSLRVWVVVLFCRSVVLFPVFYTFCIYNSVYMYQIYSQQTHLKTNFNLTLNSNPKT